MRFLWLRPKRLLSVFAAITLIAAMSSTVNAQTTLTSSPAPLTFLAKVDPTYPAEAIAAKSEGTVVLNAAISKIGTITTLKVVSADTIFRASALDAVTQWKYEPYLIDGSPTEVEATITLRYTQAGTNKPHIEISQHIDPGVAPKKIGAGITPPSVIHSVEPKEVIDKEGKPKYSGIVINLWIDEQGNPIQVHLAHGTSSILNNEAIRNVQQYKFKPAMEGTTPVLVPINLETFFNPF